MNVKQYIAMQSMPVILLILFLLVNGLALLYGSTFLRPASDDYCFGSNVAAHGIFGGVYQWWMTWAAFLYAKFLGNLFVGAPLVYLPLSLASAIPFFIALFGAGIVAYAFYPEKPQEKSGKIIFILLAAFFWWTFLWGDKAFGLQRTTFSRFAEGLTHWQTLNSTYITAALILFLIFAWILQQPDRSRPLFKIVAVFCGIAAGLAGSAVSLGYLGFSLIALGYDVFKKRPSQFPIINTDRNLWVLFCLALVVSVLLSHTLSPGYAIRRELINPDTTMSFVRLFELMVFTFKGVVRFLVRTYISLPAFFLILAITSFSSVFTKIYPIQAVSHSRLVLTSASFFLLSLAMAGAARTSQFFIGGSAYWHFSVATLCAYFALLFAGIALGFFIRSQPKYTKRIRTTCFLIMIFFTWTNFVAIGAILEREVRWRVGPAPTHNVSDINFVGFQRCFDVLNKHWAVPIIRDSCY